MVLRLLLPLSELPQDTHAVQHRQHGVQQKELRMRLLHQSQYLTAVAGLPYDLKFSRALKGLPQQ